MMYLHSHRQPRSSGRSTKSRPDHNESIAPEFSTPKTTRSTHISLSGSKRIPHLVYRPLELDSESSTESTDSLNRRKYSLRKLPTQESRTPLAIEAPRPISPTEHLLLRTKYCTNENENKVVENRSSKVNESRNKKKLFKVRNDKIKRQKVEDESLNSKSNQVQKYLEQNAIPDIIKATQCITPPITPEKVQEDEVTLLPDLPSFIPGNCNIKEVLRIYGSTTIKEMPNNGKDTS